MAYSKYRAKPTFCDGIRFASKKEAGRYQELLLLQRAKKIRELVLQQPYPMIVNGRKICVYVGDFEYFDTETGRTICEDVKGIRTPVYKLKRKLFQALYPTIEHREI